MLETRLAESAGNDPATTPAKPFRQQTLAPPRGAVIGGVIFSLLMITALKLSRLAVPTDLTHPWHLAD